MKKQKLFSPGPVMVEDNVRKALLHPDICHRSSEFEELFQKLQKKICTLFGADDSYYSLVISGSGTAANETVLSSLFASSHDKVLLISNGVFGERLEEIIQKYQIPMLKIDTPWATPPDLKDVEQVLRENPDIKVIAMVFHETSTGMINPVHEVGELSQKYGKIFFVDSVSAAAGQNIDVAENHIDITTSVGGKCLGAFPGSAYICAKESILQSLSPDQCKNVYLNLYKHYSAAKENSQTPNTPNVTLFWALDAALDNILNEGVENRVQRYAKNAEILRNGLKELGLELLIQEHLSNTVTSVFLPKHLDLHKFLSQMEMDGYTLYPGKGKYLEMGMFQVANMGAISEEDCYEFLDWLKKNLLS